MEGRDGRTSCGHKGLESTVMRGRCGKMRRGNEDDIVVLYVQEYQVGTLGTST